MPSLRSWGKSLGGCTLQPINRKKCLHLCPSQQMTSHTQGHIIYPNTGHGLVLQCWSHRGCLVVCSHSNSSSPLPAAMQGHGIAPALVYVWLIDKKSRLTCLLYLVLSHRLEKRPFRCAAICEELGQFSAKCWGTWVLCFTVDLAGLAASWYDCDCHSVSA